MSTQEKLAKAMNDGKSFLAAFYFGCLCKENGWRGADTGGKGLMAIVPPSTKQPAP